MRVLNIGVSMVAAVTAGPKWAAGARWPKPTEQMMQAMSQRAQDSRKPASRVVYDSLVDYQL